MLNNKILKYLIRPVCKQMGYITKRADEINEPGLITKKVIIKLINSDLVIADLTGHNPNAFYELALRHATGKPIILIILNIY
jgi:hypothetical protein